MHFTHSDIQKHRRLSDFQPWIGLWDKNNQCSGAPGRLQESVLCAEIKKG